MPVRSDLSWACLNDYQGYSFAASINPLFWTWWKNFTGVSRLNRSSPTSRYGPVVVPKGKLFVMGDNHYNSADSRYLGFVESETVESKAWGIYWSKIPDNDTFKGINFNRIFKKIE